LDIKTNIATPRPSVEKESTVLNKREKNNQQTVQPSNYLQKHNQIRGIFCSSHDQTKNFSLAKNVRFIHEYLP
jgi:hypothetical protein